MVTGGALFLPLSKDVLRGVLDASLEAPDELTQITFVLNLPPAPFVPAELVGTPAVMVLPVVLGDPEAGAAAMAPFRSLATPIADLVGPMPYPAMYNLTGRGREPGPGRRPVVVRDRPVRQRAGRDRRPPRGRPRAPRPSPRSGCSAGPWAASPATRRRSPIATRRS